jgi:hypothetical protein
MADHIKHKTSWELFSSIIQLEVSEMELMIAIKKVLILYLLKGKFIGNISLI